MTLTTQAPVIVWFRQDLRLADNPALTKAVELKAPIIPIYVLSDEDEKDWAMGAASRFWLHHSLLSLQNDLQKKGLTLILQNGSALDVLQRVVDQTNANVILWNRRYEPSIIKRDAAIKQHFVSKGLSVESFNASLLFEPWTVKTKQGNPYKVFTPFWRECQKLQAPNKPLEMPSKWIAYKDDVKCKELKELELLPKINWTQGMVKSWQVGEKNAHKLLNLFLDGIVNDYQEGRNQPSVAGTSRLSPYLHFGEISPRQIWWRFQEMIHKQGEKFSLKDAECYLAEIGWREFAYHLLFHFPHTVNSPLQEKFKSFAWHKNKAQLKAWQKGLTGYPIVDAGMRELWHTGWMHNRVRMIVASFLIKDLLIDWQEGARWFWDTLLDADLASNTLGWQWTAGCGADAAPFFRIFNPTTQGERFDVNGEYVKRWVPELAKLPTKWIHKPHLAPKDLCDQLQFKIGVDYPHPIVNHAEARELALNRFRQI